MTGLTKMDNNQHFYIVGIGASAGGLEALERFFQALPDEPNMAFVVIQHLSPDYKSMMAEILSKYTAMPVNEAKNNTQVKPNHVYLIPPKKNITIKDKHLFLTEKEIHRGIPLPIDTFLHSLAQDCHEYAIAVILSGTGSDGTRGIRAIKEHDGMVVVQQIKTAKFDGMPASAIDTGLADFVLPPEEMPRALMDFVCHPNLLVDREAEDKKDRALHAGNEIEQILDIVKDHSDVNFHQYKDNTVLRRIERRAGIRQCTSIADYLSLLAASETEQNTLYRELLIGVTKFFRDNDVFFTLAQEIIPQLFAAANDDPIRIWVAGCSTGEEAYSIAILLAEFKAQTGHHNEIKIFATDIDQNAIETAAVGTYSESIAADIEPDLLARYFSCDEHEGRYTVTQTIRSMVVFARHDLTKSPPFNRLNFISCRNLFIYLRPEVQERILHLFHFSLKASGFLLLGESETIGDASKLFTCLESSLKFYQARAGLSPKIPVLHDIAVNLPVASDAIPERLQYTSGRGTSRRTEDYLQRLVVDKLLPACFLITDNLDTLYISRQGTKYLSFSGTPDYNLSRSLDEGIAAFIRSAVTKALKNNRTVVYKTLDNPNDALSALEIKVEPLAKKHSGAQLLLVTFEQSLLPKRDEEKDEVAIEITADTRQHIEDLERELSYTRETLQATIEELETSNEELQSTNEELLASNEELQATNEELQAVNEELITVNSEYQHKIREVTRLNDMHNNLLRSSKVGSVFLDANFQIRSFTPAVRDEILLRDSDIGRPFLEVRHHLQIDDLESKLAQTLQNEEMLDIEVQSNLGNWYILRLAPFLLGNQSIDGVVLTLINISERKQALDALAVSESNLKRAQKLAHLGSWQQALGSRHLVCSEEMCHILGIEAPDARLNYELFLQYVHSDDRKAVDSAYRKALSHNEEGYEIEHRIVRQDDESLRYVLQRCEFQRDESDQVCSLRGMILDITERRLAEEESRKLSRAVAQSVNAVIITNAQGHIEFVNPAFEKSSGYGAEEMIGQSLGFLNADTHPSDFFSEMWQHIQTTGTWQGEVCNRHKNGHLYWDFATVSVVRDDKDDITHYISIQENITARKQAQDELRQQRDQLQLYFEQPVVGMITAHADKGIMNVNSSFCQLIGYSAEELLDPYMDWDKLIPPNNAQVDAEQYARMLSGKIDSYQLETSYLHKDGHSIPVYMNVSCTRDETGHIENVVKIISDLTHQQQQKQALIEARKQAEAANHAKSLFLANMSHELRTPLNAIHGFAELLHQSTELPSSLAAHAEKIMRGGDHLLTLINDILDLAKIEAGRIEIQTEIIDLKEFLDDIESMVRMRANQKSLRCQFVLSSLLPQYVQTDPKRLRQVLLNLLGNAVKFTEQGSVSLSVDYQNGELMLQVKDTGTGIAPEYQQVIFEPFIQIGTDRYKSLGTGLGLAITHEIVSLMQGKINVQSKPDHGACFSVNIPIAAISERQQQQQQQRKIGMSQNIIGYRRTDTRANNNTPFHILVVDDVEDNSTVLSEQLRLLNFTVSEAYSGEMCLKAIADSHFDLVLLDMRMPHMDGLEVLRRLQKVPDAPPVIMVSANVYQQDKQTAIELGALGYLYKPVTLADLVYVLQKYLPLDWQYPAPSAQETHRQQKREHFATDWLEELKRVVSYGDRNRLLDMLNECQSQGMYIPRNLQEWVDNYEYFQILQWIEQIEAEQSPTDEG